MAATIHLPDSTLKRFFDGTMKTGNTIKCALIDISTYDRVTDTVLSDVTQVTGTGYTAGGQTVTSIAATTDTTNHWSLITITPAVWAGATTISATGAVIYDSSDSNKIMAVVDFGGTVASSGGTYTVDPIILKFTHF
jgi:hypothetical protein